MDCEVRANGGRLMSGVARRRLGMVTMAGALGLLCVMVGTARAQASSSGVEQTALGKTEPSARRQLSFNGPGVILDVAVKEGDHVKEGQLLMSEDARMEEKLLEAMKLESDSVLPVEFATTDLAYKQNKLSRVENMAKNAVASNEELQEAKLDVALAEIKVKQASQEQKQKKLQADRQAIKVELMKLKSPIAGIVEKLDLGAGEVVDPNKPSCTVVQNDPLWVEVHVPSLLARQVSVGDAMSVQNEGEKAWESAKVIFLAPVADAASGTRMVRLELANPTGRPSGMQVTVKLPPPAAASGKLEVGSAK